MDHIESTDIQVLGPTALEVETKAAISVSIATAHEYPRDIVKFKNNAIAMATMSKEIAQSCQYEIPRGGKKIAGKSIRLAEIVAANYGNLRVETRIVSVDDNVIIVEGMAHDLESNYAEKSPVTIPIRDKNGKRYTEQVINSNVMAALAKAKRNAVFSVVPGGLTELVYQETISLLLGNAKTIGDRRVAAIKYLGEYDATEKQILAYLGRRTVEHIDGNDIQNLLGVVKAVKDGSVTMSEALAPPEEEKKAPAKTLDDIVDGKGMEPDADKKAAAEQVQKEAAAEAKTKKDKEVSAKDSTDMTDEEKTKIEKEEADLFANADTKGK